jgi:hypothetical protein
MAKANTRRRCHRGPLITRLVLRTLTHQTPTRPQSLRSRQGPPLVHGTPVSRWCDGEHTLAPSLLSLPEGPQLRYRGTVQDRPGRCPDAGVWRILPCRCPTRTTPWYWRAPRSRRSAAPAHRSLRRRSDVRATSCLRNDRIEQFGRLTKLGRHVVLRCLPAGQARSLEMIKVLTPLIVSKDRARAAILPCPPCCGCVRSSGRDGLLAGTRAGRNERHESADAGKL